MHLAVAAGLAPATMAPARMGLPQSPLAVEIVSEPAPVPAPEVEPEPVQPAEAPPQAISPPKPQTLAPRQEITPPQAIGPAKSQAPVLHAQTVKPRAPKLKPEPSPAALVQSVPTPDVGKAVDPAIDNGGTPAEAAPPVPAKPQDTPDDRFQRYAETVWARIMDHKPSRIRSRGTVVLTFSLLPDGGLAAAAITGASGQAELDRAALFALRAAAPFPLPPEDATAQQLTFTIPFQFR
jgi:protein TonB